MDVDLTGGKGSKKLGLLSRGERKTSLYVYVSNHESHNLLREERLPSLSPHQKKEAIEERDSHI